MDNTPFGWCDSALSDSSGSPKKLPFVCRGCNLRRYMFKSDIQRHIRFHCRANSTPSLGFCHYCVRIFADDNSLRVHLRSATHQRQLQLLQALADNQANLLGLFISLPSNTAIQSHQLQEVFVNAWTSRTLSAASLAITVKQTPDARERYRLALAMAQCRSTRLTACLVVAQAALLQTGDVLLDWSMDTSNAIHQTDSFEMDSCIMLADFCRFLTQHSPDQSHPLTLMIPTIDAESAPGIIPVIRSIKIDFNIDVYVPVQPIARVEDCFSWASILLAAFPGVYFNNYKQK
eukprot:TRINITY_DN1146_c0_g1::TRINITY_DN1146_c0_g1_i1::g.17355::m.17355 TRINITY_DN1146_c0_g1::TRINITY_DN1146_c0_g1_i1::g.17355  ORF type:complete len:290 (-),score=2.25,zf-C2H2/PF00096.21/2.2,zf-C2H2/PF00096.21/0.18,zf-C2H2_jaz/PF12171.3/0.03 TRINITY_DN1146_c0_g1_i1:532-1401(-)